VADGVGAVGSSLTSSNPDEEVILIKKDRESKNKLTQSLSNTVSKVSSTLRPKKRAEDDVATPPADNNGPFTSSQSTPNVSLSTSPPSTHSQSSSFQSITPKASHQAQPQPAAHSPPNFTQTTPLSQSPPAFHRSTPAQVPSAPVQPAAHRMAPKSPPQKFSASPPSSFLQPRGHFIAKERNATHPPIFKTATPTTPRAKDDTEIAFSRKSIGMEQEALQPTSKSFLSIRTGGRGQVTPYSLSVESLRQLVQKMKCPEEVAVAASSLYKVTSNFKGI
jgi:hypothetical protein